MAWRLKKALAQFERESERQVPALRAALVGFVLVPGIMARQSSCFTTPFQTFLFALRLNAFVMCFLFFNPRLGDVRLGGLRLLIGWGFFVTKGFKDIKGQLDGL